MVKRICKTCRKEFYVKPSKIKRGEGKYCSNDCKYIGLVKTKIKRICPVCKREFLVYPSVTKKQWWKILFCGML